MTKASSPKPIFLLPKKPDHDDDSGSSPRGDYIAFTNTSSSNDGSFESTTALKVIHITTLTCSIVLQGTASKKQVLDK